MTKTYPVRSISKRQVAQAYSHLLETNVYVEFLQNLAGTYPRTAATIQGSPIGKVARDRAHGAFPGSGGLHGAGEGEVNACGGGRLALALETHRGRVTSALRRVPSEDARYCTGDTAVVESVVENEDTVSWLSWDSCAVAILQKPRRNSSSAEAPPLSLCCSFLVEVAVKALFSVCIVLFFVSHLRPMGLNVLGYQSHLLRRCHHHPVCGH